VIPSVRIGRHGCDKFLIRLELVWKPVEKLVELNMSLNSKQRNILTATGVNTQWHSSVARAGGQ
jgi:hypothetical protein